MLDIAGQGRSSSLFLLVGRFETGDIELGHLEHCLHHPVRFHRILVQHQLPEDRRDDLPGETVFVLEPAALILSAALGELLPEIVHLVLHLAVDEERDGLGEGEVRSTIDRRKFLPVETERDEQDRTRRAGAALSVVTDVYDFGVGKIET